MSESTAPPPSGFQLAGGAPEAYERYLRLIMAPFVDAMLARAGVTADESVLDVATGTGFVARAAARVVGPSGRVVGLDVNGGMLAAAAAAARDTTPSIEWVESSALDMRLEDGSFDAVLCQQGVQFFPDLVQALREMRRVARPGGRILVSFWGARDAVPYFDAHIEAMGRVLGAAAMAPLERGIGLPPQVVLDAAHAAGLSDVEADEVTAEVSLPPLADFVPAHTAALPMAAAYAALSPEVQAQAAAEIAGRLSPYATPEGGVTVPFGSHIVSARVPAG